jgi:putative ABC transport system permease protein
MKRTFFKNLYRDTKKTLTSFLSIVVIIAVGTAFYAGVRATSPDMKISGDYYFSKNNLMDFKVISTLGLIKDDAAEIQKLKGITVVEGSKSLDAVTEINKKQIVLNINSLPDENGINSIKMVRGRRPQKADEAVVEEKFFQKNKLKLNGRIVLKSGNDTSLSDDLKNTEFKIVGTADSPLYVSEQRQLSSVGNGSVKGFVYILPEVFKSDVYTEIYARAGSTQSKNSLMDNESYKNNIKNVEKELKDIGPSRNELRYAKVLKNAVDELNDAKIKLGNSKTEAAKKFKDGYDELNAAKDKIIKGKEALDENEALFKKKMEDGQKQIENGKKQIESAESNISTKKKELENGKRQLASAKQQLDDSEAKLNEGKKQAADQISSGIYGEVLKSKQLMEENPDYAAQYNFLNSIYENDIKGKDFDTMYSFLKRDNAIDSLKPYFDIEKLKNNFDKSEAEINSGRLKLDENEKKLQDGANELNKGIAEINANKKKISDAEDKLDKAKDEGMAKLQSARLELENGERQIEANGEKLKSEEKSANAKFKDAEAEIQKNSDKLDDIKKPEWYVLGRSENVGYETYRQDGDRIGSIGRAFPLIFFLVASLVSLTTMTRMVQDKRIEAGTFKAIGYTSFAIVCHYFIYSLLASVIGSAIGVLSGFRLFPSFIMNAYGSLYTIPYRLTPFNMSIALQASLVAILFTCSASIAAAIEELREAPASLMRPKQPKSGSRIWLEKINFIWKKLSFTRKVTARNIFRYKQRLFMTIVGIAACTGLMITGFGLKEAITGATKAQFTSIYRYDMQGTLNKNVNETVKNDIKQKAKDDSNIKSILFAYSKNASVESKSGESQDAYIVVPEDKALLNNYINLVMKGSELKLGDNGVILTEKLSKTLNKKVGDSIYINLNDKITPARVSAVTEHYIQNYIYMSPAYYRKITGDDAAFNSFYGLLKNTSETYENNTSGRLKAIKGINFVTFKDNVRHDSDRSLDSVNAVVIILIISAGVLAFVVIYNLTNINIIERRRELATIKLLGFYDHELALYIYRENMILTIIGSLAGIPAGILIDRYVITTAETNVLMFMNKISPIYFVYSILLTIIFSVIVNLAMYRRFDKIDMIESLKSAE